MLHLAAQVAVTTSLDDPVARLRGQRRAARSTCSRRCARRPEPPPLVFASTNKVYGELLGDADWRGVARRAGEPARRRLARARHRRGARRSTSTAPMAARKGVADQYVLDYARIFGLRDASSSG